VQGLADRCRDSRSSSSIPARVGIHQPHSLCGLKALRHGGLKLCKMRALNLQGLQLRASELQRSTNLLRTMEGPRCLELASSAPPDEFPSSRCGHTFCCLEDLAVQHPTCTTLFIHSHAVHSCGGGAKKPPVILPPGAPRAPPSPEHPPPVEVGTHLHVCESSVFSSAGCVLCELDLRPLRLQSCHTCVQHQHPA
jgi:hypothetical protein